MRGVLDGAPDIGEREEPGTQMSASTPTSILSVRLNGSILRRDAVRNPDCSSVAPWFPGASLRLNSRFGIGLEEAMGLAQVTRLRSMSAGDLIYRQGHRGDGTDSIFLITEGEVTLQIRIRDAFERPLAHLTVGDLFGGVPSIPEHEAMARASPRDRASARVRAANEQDPRARGRRPLTQVCSSLRRKPPNPRRAA